jgi:hypothetical protein
MVCVNALRGNGLQDIYTEPDLVIERPLELAYFILVFDRVCPVDRPRVDLQITFA